MMYTYNCKAWTFWVLPELALCWCLQHIMNFN